MVGIHFRYIVGFDCATFDWLVGVVIFFNAHRRRRGASHDHRDSWKWAARAHTKIYNRETLAGDGGSTKRKKEKEKKKEAGGMMVQSSADYGVTLRAFPRIYPHNKRRRTDDRR